MSDKNLPNSNNTHGATTIHGAKSGGSGAAKWLVGALAAVVLAGGGFLAWKTMQPGEANTSSAYNDASSTPPAFQQTAPVEPSQNATTDNHTTAQTNAAPPSSERTTTHARRAPTRTASIPEETIGVAPPSATAQADENVTVTGRRAVWARVPSAQRLASYYPNRALDMNREGEASLRCTVLDNGALDCVRVSETRGGYGFGNAALSVSRTLRHAPQLANGRDAAGSALNLRVVFRMADDDRPHWRG